MKRIVKELHENNLQQLLKNNNFNNNQNYILSKNDKILVYYYSLSIGVRYYEQFSYMLKEDKGEYYVEININKIGNILKFLLKKYLIFLRFFNIKKYKKYKKYIISKKSPMSYKIYLKKKKNNV